VFGGFTTTPWAVTVTAQGPEYYGTGESFLYSLTSDSRSSSSSSSSSSSIGGQIQQEEEHQHQHQHQQQQHQHQHQHQHQQPPRRNGGGTAAARTARGAIQVYPWSRENNLNMLSWSGGIAMGGGGGQYGIFLGENFESGVSGACMTYLNPPLAAKGKHFDVLDLEWCVGAWGRGRGKGRGDGCVALSILLVPVVFLIPPTSFPKLKKTNNSWTLEEPTILLAREQQLSERRAGMHQRSYSLDPRCDVDVCE
jgi:hypothetical protein